jgi:hypothetical protein
VRAFAPQLDLLEKRGGLGGSQRSIGTLSFQLESTLRNELADVKRRVPLTPARPGLA